MRDDMIQQSQYQEKVWFIDNAEDRIVIEVDTEWYESLERDLLNHLGLPPNWSTTKREYLGDTYIVTIERLWL